ncbi:MAG: hypothetical protein H7258_06865 [Ferruginibacter sp.]|nr:hypothetical protein [Ferruginibacter sp.]
MSLQEFEKKNLTERERGLIRMRSIMDYGMGILWLAMGIFMIFIKQFNTGLEARFDDATMKAFGAICIFYGSFRIYRGYKKNYLKER